ncbi:MAG: hypothetical protein M8352_03440 [ANME-2 cluster archaeon]|nr:hypothetical protein [ANME-2 cluster archaeon]MDF1531857.1 ATPase domain-containing protein [ANME-2 cluster archaeon]
MKQVISGISGLDEILGKGFTRPSTVLIGGVMGTGKTTFTMQSLFNAAREDEICMYITAISEPIAMINTFMSRFSFYSISMMGKGNVKYVPLDPEQIKKGSSAIVQEIERNIEVVKPDRIVIDPVNVLTSWMDEREKREFYYHLFNKMKGWNSLVLITGEFSGEHILKDAISYIADGVIYLSNERLRHKRVRHLEVLKMRGQKYLSGKHSFEITDDGFEVYPSLHPDIMESLTYEHVPTGIKGLDNMTNGGFIRGSNVLLSGGSGTGKTLIGLQFIVDGATMGEPGVIVSLEEDPVLLRNNAACFGWNLEKLEADGLLKIIYSNVSQLDVNKMALEIKTIVEELGAKRVVLDGVNNLKIALLDDLSMGEYISVLSRYFSSRNIISLFTNETSELMGSSTITGNGTSVVMDSIILLRYVEIQSEMKKTISVLKMRGSNHDKEIRELVINQKGVEVKLPFTEYSGLMSGNPVKSPSQAFVEAFKK